MSSLSRLKCLPVTFFIRAVFFFVVGREEKKTTTKTLFIENGEFARSHYDILFGWQGMEEADDQPGSRTPHLGTNNREKRFTYSPFGTLARKRGDGKQKRRTAERELRGPACRATECACALIFTSDINILHRNVRCREWLKHGCLC